MFGNRFRRTPGSKWARRSTTSGAARDHVTPVTRLDPKWGRLENYADEGGRPSSLQDG